MRVVGRLDGAVALITGAGRGMGEAEARLFASEGAAVVLTDVLVTEGEAVAADLGSRHRTVFRPLDVRESEAWQEAVAFAEQTFGKLDVLVNNAGIASYQRLDASTLEDWEQMIGINQTGTFLGMKTVVPAMRRAGGGAIVNVSSTAGLVGIPGSSIAYTASKGAVRLMTKFAAVELARDNIRVNSVHPGRISTDMTSGQTPERMAMMETRTPLGRSGKPQEVANGVLFLASPDSSFITGTELVIDGGYTAQ